jgi:hypothetical protein
MVSKDTRRTAEFLIEFWLGIGILYLSVIHFLPPAIFVPDAVLTILAALATGFDYDEAAGVLLGIAWLLLIVGIVISLHQGFF